MTALIAVLACLVVAILGAQPASASPNDNPNFGYDENGIPRANLKNFRQGRAHQKGQAQKNKRRKNK